MRTTIKGPLGHDLFIDVVSKPCPICGYTAVMAMTSESGHSFVAWCPCGTVYDEEEGYIRTSQHPPMAEWWKVKEI